MRVLEIMIQVLAVVGMALDLLSKGFGLKNVGRHGARPPIPDKDGV
jgi:hypothetical protein